MKLKDITLKRVKLAYKRTGLAPGPGTKPEFGRGRRRSACALVALAKDVGLKSWNDVLENDEKSIDFGVGFDYGIRGEVYTGHRMDNPACRKGYNVGALLRRDQNWLHKRRKK